MEHIAPGTYHPVLKNEVIVRSKEIKELFSSGTNVYIFGYGSLLYSKGWLLRGLHHPPKENELIECHLSGFERGPWGLFGENNYYGVIRKAKSNINGVIAHIKNINEWVALMCSETVAGISYQVNYRVVDVTREIYGISNHDQLKAPYTVHCVVNRPGNKNAVQHSFAMNSYYGRVWEGIQSERSEAFQKEFLRKGGFRNSDGVSAFLSERRKN